MLPNTLLEIQNLVGETIEDSKSPAGNWLQPRLEGIEKGYAKISVVVRKEMCNPYGNIHGGMMALVMDENIGWAMVSSGLPVHYTSVTLNLDFLYAAAEGERIFSEAKIVRAGKKIVNVEVMVHNENKVLLAKASSNLVVTSMIPLEK